MTVLQNISQSDKQTFPFLGLCETWVHSCVDGPLPPLAVVGGNDSDGTTLFIGRAYHDGDILPVKINPSNKTAYTCCEGYEIYKEHYEVLCGTGYSWIHCENGVIPINAVSCGQTCKGEIVYIGRGHYDRSLTVGKVFRGDDCLYIPFGGRERRIHRYEVLIKNSYVVPAETCETGSYVIPAETGGCYVPSVTGSCVIPAKTGGDFGPTNMGTYVVPAKTGGGFDPADTGSYVVPAYNQPPPYSGLYPQVSSASAPSLSPPPSVAGFIKHEASYPASPENAYPAPPSLGFIKNESSVSTTYPAAPYPPPTFSSAPIKTATIGSVVEMPMPQPPPPYELKEEVAVTHKKPPAFGFQVSLVSVCPVL